MNDDLFYTYKTGKLTVVGFNGKHLASNRLNECRDQLIEMIYHSECEYLVVELMDVSVVNSWILGILASIRSKGVQIELYHPSVSMCEVLETTHINQLLHIRE